jgi:hypothetical protein
MTALRGIHRLNIRAPDRATSLDCFVAPLLAMMDDVKGTRRNDSD